MNTSIDAANEALINPSPYLKEALAGANDEAKKAIKSILPEQADGSLDAILHTNGDSRRDTDRLQVVDEVGRIAFSKQHTRRLVMKRLGRFAEPAFHVSRSWTVLLY